MSTNVTFGGRTITISSETAAILETILGIQAAVETPSTTTTTQVREPAEMTIEEAVEVLAKATEHSTVLYRPTVTIDGTVKVKKLVNADDVADADAWITAGLVSTSFKKAKKLANALDALMYKEVSVPKSVPAIGEDGYYITIEDGVFVLKAHTRTIADDKLVKAKRLSKNRYNAVWRINELNQLIGA